MRRQTTNAPQLRSASRFLMQGADTTQAARKFNDELWRRRQARREQTSMRVADHADAELVPLVLALARLGAQRDTAHAGRGCIDQSATPETMTLDPLTSEIGSMEIGQ